MMKSLLLTVSILLTFVSAQFAQNKFEGYNIILDVPTTHRSPTCAMRFVAPTTSITVTDIDRATPMRVSSCGGSASSLVQSGASAATMKASPTDYKWCFEGEDKRYRITFAGDQYSGPVTYDWIATPPANVAGFFNIRDFGAVGDGRTDDTIAIKSAMAYIAARNGGTLSFPEGDYVVTSPVTLPSGIVIQGTNGLTSNSPVSNLPRKNPTRIKLSGANKALFRVGECTGKVTLRDIELYSESNIKTIGVEAMGAYDSAQGLFFERVAFHNFSRGIYAYGLPQTDLNWQIDYVKVQDSLFVFNTDAAIYTNSRNSDWKIEGTVFINPPRRPGQNADSMKFERAAGILIQDTFGGGFANAKGGTFLDILDNGGATIISSSTEQMTNSMVFNSERNPLAGNYSGPVTVINSGFGDPIVFNARRTYVSTGNSYAGNTFTADAGVRVYSFGDRFCADGYIIGCQSAPKTLFDKATIVFMTGQPGEGTVTGHPTFFGTDVQFGAGVQMPSFAQTSLPANKPNGTMVYCTNCRRSTTPCQSGGSGSPAMVVGNQWSCL